MKTSTTQFEMIVNFMEQHGDLTKPSKCAKGKIDAIKNWNTLKDLLNSDPTGDFKTVEKWKKVWSDFKNNIKKKAAKINRAACGTGGGPALQLRLSELEQRVLNLIGPQVATGLLGVAEAGLVQDLQDEDRTATLSPTPAAQGAEESPSILNYMQSHAIEHFEVNVQVSPQLWDQPGPSHRTHVPPETPPTQQGTTLAPQPPTTPVQPQPTSTEPQAQATEPRTPPRNEGYPARRGHTPRGRRARRLASPRPRRPLVRQLSHVEQAAQQFVNADERWRQFLVEKHADEMRMKELELQAQQRWQEIASQAISAINKIAESKLFKE